MNALPWPNALNSVEALFELPIVTWPTKIP